MPLRIEPIPSHVTDIPKHAHECSDHIFVDQHVFEDFFQETDAGTVCCVRLTNRVGQTAVGTLHAVIHEGEEDVLYAPTWICDLLDFDWNDITITRAELDLCTSLLIQPHTSEHLHVADAQEYFRSGFEAYTCICSGVVLPLLCEGADAPVYVSIVRVTPDTEEGRFVCIRGSEIALELLPPLDAPLPVPPVAPTEVTSAETAASSTTCGTRLGGQVYTESIQELVRRAALQRYVAAAAGHQTSDSK